MRLQILDLSESIGSGGPGRRTSDPTAERPTSPFCPHLAVP